MSSRRGIIGAAGVGAAFLASMPLSKQAYANRISDADILNFALNLEYLEAEFYLRAVTGAGLDPTDRTGVGDAGVVLGGSQVPFKTTAMQQYAMEIAADERAHVQFLRQALGGSAVAAPTIDLSQSFTTAAMAAGVIKSGQTFNPFADEQSFLLGAFIFEDVGVTAYHGAAPLIRNKKYLDAAAGILAVEAYHAATVRTLLYQQGLSDPVNKISALRATASGAQDDQGVVVNGMANIVPADQNGLAFDRTPDQILKIVYLRGAAANNGFFPEGVNGVIA